MSKIRPLFLLLLALPLLVFTSCNDDDEPEPEPLPTLEGKWALDFLELTELPSAYQSYEGEFNAALLGVMNLEYLFTIDGTDQEFVEYADAFNGLTFTTDGEWEFNDDQTELTLAFDGGNDQVFEVLTFNLQNMAIQIEEVFSLPNPNSPDPENPVMENVNATVIYHYYKLY
jgi:hypothetical protein